MSLFQQYLVLTEYFSYQNNSSYISKSNYSHKHFFNFFKKSRLCNKLFMEYI